MRPSRRHQQPARPLKMRAQAVEDLAAAPQPETRGQRLVKLDVERVEDLAVVRLHRLALAGEARRERREPLAVEAARRFGGDLAFERVTDKQPLAHVVDGDARDERAVLRLDHHQLFEGEPAHRRRDGKTRDGQPFAQSRLVDWRARLQGARQDRLLQLAIDVLGLVVDALAHRLYQLPRRSGRRRRAFRAGMSEAKERAGGRQPFVGGDGFALARRARGLTAVNPSSAVRLMRHSTTA